MKEVSRTTFALKHFVLRGHLLLETAVNITKIMKYSYAPINLFDITSHIRSSFLNICLWSKEFEECHKLDLKNSPKFSKIVIIAHFICFLKEFVASIIRLKFVTK